ncbi:MAG: BMP family ABC transporter substrate-binding protein [Oscillospiraceae bacterium]|nr:BMP family ABC transporter substrate-binding protein [Oscillospiraceae bacterium]
MLKRFCCVWLAFIFLFVSGCGKSAAVLTDESPDGEVCRILFVTDDIGEKRSSFIWELLQNAVDGNRVQATLTEVDGQADKTSATLNQVSEGVYDIVILDRLSGEQSLAWVQRNAGYYPDVHYICMDVGTLPEFDFDNVTGVVWKDAEAYCFLGAVAAVASKTGTVAFFAQPAGERAELDFLAFYEGAACVNENIRAQFYTVSSGARQEDLLVLAESAIASGADMFCLQNDSLVELLSDVLISFGEQAEDVYFLTGEEPAVRRFLHTDNRVILDFKFDSKQILTELINDCCQGEPLEKIILAGWENDRLQFEYGGAYAAILDAEARGKCVVLRQRIMSGELTEHLNEVLSQEDRHMLIQKAGEMK